MSYNRYGIEEIEIGDEVFFDDDYSGKYLAQSNYDQYWTVHGKDRNMLLVNLQKKHYWSIDIKDVRQLIKIKREVSGIDFDRSI